MTRHLFILFVCLCAFATYGSAQTVPSDPNAALQVKISEIETALKQRLQEVESLEMAPPAEGSERAAIVAEAGRLGIADRVHLPGFVADPAKVVGLFDLFALSSDSEQFPLSVVEAMASGLAVASTDVGDISAMLTPENRAFLVPPAKEGDFADAVERLALDPALRSRIGEANRAKARAEFDEAAMIAAYRQIYGAALGHPAFP